MVWNDTYLSQRVCLPKWLYYITCSGALIMTYGAIYSVIQKTELIEKILPAIGSFLFAFYGLSNILLIWRGSEYIEKIKKEEDQFTIINIYNKQITFKLCDIYSVVPSKFSLINFFLSGFVDYRLGLALYLKDGHMYRITVGMEDIENLKRALTRKENSS